MFVLLALAGGHRDLERDADLAAATPPATTPSTADAHEGLLYGRVPTDDSAIYQGRLRFGGDEEGLWGNYFNGVKDENPWAAHAPHEQLPKERLSVEVFGIEIAGWDFRLDLGRPFMARFGDIARIDARGRDLRVMLRSGTVVKLDRFGADDFDGWRIRTIQLLPTAPLGAAPYPLHGTVRTRHGDFTGLVQWDREACLGSDELEGHTADGPLSLRFATIRSIERHSLDGSLVTLLDGHEVVLSGTHQVGQGNPRIYVDDPRYGRAFYTPPVCLSRPALAGAAA